MHHLTNFHLQLYIPSALAIASDFWRVTVIGVIAARQGSLEVRQPWLLLVI